MPLDVGSLQASFSVNTDDFQSEFKNAIDQGIKNADQLGKAIGSAGTRGVEEFQARLEQAMKASADIAPLIQKGLSGIDSSKLDELKSNVVGVNDEFEVLQKTVQFVKDNLSSFTLEPAEMEQLRAGLEQISNTFQNIHTNETSATGELRQLKELLARLPQGSSLFQQVLHDAGDLQEKVKTVRTELKLATQNAPGMAALAQGVRGLVGSFQALQGVSVLLSGGNEELDQSVKTLIASMSILQGIEEVMHTFEKDSALSVFLNANARKAAAASTAEQATASTGLAGAEAAEAVATEAAATAQEGLNTAMKLNPAGILLIAIGALATAILTLGSSSEKASEKADRLNKHLQEQLDLAKQLTATDSRIQDQDKDIDSLDKEIQRRKAAGATESEIGKLQVNLSQERIKREGLVGVALENTGKKLGVTYDQAKKELVDLLKKQDDFIEKQKTLFEGKTNIFTDADKVLEKKVSDRLQKEKESNTSRIKLLTDFVDASDQNDKKLTDLTAQGEEERAAIALKAGQDALKSAAAFAEARLILAKKNSDEERVAAIASIRARAAAEIGQTGITAGEIAKIRAQEAKDIEAINRAAHERELTDEKDLLERRLINVKEGSLQEMELKVNIIEQERKIELQQLGLSEEEKKKIRAEAFQKILKLNEDFFNQLSRDEIETTLASTNAKLAVSKKGSADELTLKEQQIDIQAKLDIEGANQTIKNEQLLAAKILEIHQNSIAARKALEEDYVRNFLQRQFEKIDQQTTTKNDAIQDVLTNPKSTSTQKYTAQLQSLTNQLDALKQKQSAVANEIQGGRGDLEELNKQWNSLDESIKQVNREMNNLTENKFADGMKKLGSEMTSIANSFASLSESLKDINPKLSATLESLSEIGKIGGDAASAIGNFASGNIVGGITSSLDFIKDIVNFFGAAKKSRIEAEKEIDDFNEKVLDGEVQITEEYRQRQREQVKLNQLKLEGLQKEKELLEQQKQAVADQYNSILQQLQQQSFVADETTKKFGGILGLGRKTKTVQIFETLAGKSFDELEKLFDEGRLTGKAADLFQLLQKVKQEGADINDLLQQNADEAKQIFTGTTSDSISDAIIEGFKAGKHGAADFADTFQDLMRQALIQSLKFKYLEKPLNDFFDEFAAAAESDNTLTSSEVSQLQDMFNSIIGNADQQFKQLQQIAGINFGATGGSNNTLSGAIKGITESQAELLAGQFGGLRLTAIDILTVNRRSLDAAIAIQSNTAIQVARMVDLLDKFNQYETGQKLLNVKVH